MIKKLALPISFVIILIVFSSGWAAFFQFGLTGFLIFVSSLLTFQSLFTLRWMLYAWNSFKGNSQFETPKDTATPKTSFTILLPVRHEVGVLEDTLKALERIEYPKELIEILILCRNDDVKTIDLAKNVITDLGATNMFIKIFNGTPVNKPHSLNIGLSLAKNDMVVIFDAEDEPHSSLFKLVNTIMIKENPDVIQGGVQLVDYNSHWYSLLNVLEYYFWFKSGLYYFSNNCGAAPLAGNTVFFKRDVLIKINGWDENCLAEDADVGVRLSVIGAKIKILYVEKYATKEETPHNVKAFIKQRTRWNQGFLQVLGKGDWLTLPTFKAKSIILYLLIAPFIQTLILFYTPFGIYLAGINKFSVPVTLITYLPFYMVLIQVAVYIFGFYKFITEYRLNFSLVAPVKLVLTYVPYQLLLFFSSFRALGRFLFNINGWEKTLHQNNHRLAETDD